MKRTEKFLDFGRFLRGTSFALQNFLLEAVEEDDKRRVMAYYPEFFTTHDNFAFASAANREVAFWAIEQRYHAEDTFGEGDEASAATLSWFGLEKIVFEHCADNKPLGGSVPLPESYIASPGYTYDIFTPGCSPRMFKDADGVMYMALCEIPTENTDFLVVATPARYIDFEPRQNYEE